MRRGFALGLLALVVAGCDFSGQPRVPTATEARSFLQSVVSVAQSADFDALCRLGGGNCEDYLDLEGGRDVPTAAPVVVGDRVIPSTGIDAGTVGGRVLELCGRTDAGELYYSEMLVFFDYSGDLHAIEPEYWMGIRISEDASAGQHVEDEPPAECQGRA